MAESANHGAIASTASHQASISAAAAAPSSPSAPVKALADHTEPGRATDVTKAAIDEALADPLGMRRAELPADMQTEDFEDTACRYCGVSYIVMSELREMQDRVIRAEAIVEGWRDRISRTVAAEAAKEQAEAAAEHHRRIASASQRKLASIRRSAEAVRRASLSAARSIRTTSAEIKSALQATGFASAPTPSECRGGDATGSTEGQLLGSFGQGWAAAAAAVVAAAAAAAGVRGRREVAELRTKLDAAELAVEEAEEASADRIAAAESGKRAAEAEAAKLRAELHLLRTEAASASDASKAAFRRAEASLIEVDRHRAAAATATAEMERIRSEHEATDAEFRRTITDLSEQLRTARTSDSEELKRLRKQLQESETRLEEVTATSSEAQSQLQVRIQTAEQRAAELERTAADAQASAKQLAEDLRRAERRRVAEVSAAADGAADAVSQARQSADRHEAARRKAEADWKDLSDRSAMESRLAADRLKDAQAAKRLAESQAESAKHQLQLQQEKTSAYGDETAAELSRAKALLTAANQRAVAAEAARDAESDAVASLKRRVAELSAELSAEAERVRARDVAAAAAAERAEEAEKQLADATERFDAEVMAARRDGDASRVKSQLSTLAASLPGVLTSLAGASAATAIPDSNGRVTASAAGIHAELMRSCGVEVSGGAGSVGRVDDGQRRQDVDGGGSTDSSALSPALNVNRLTAALTDAASRVERGAELLRSEVMSLRHTVERECAERLELTDQLESLRGPSSGHHITPRSSASQAHGHGRPAPEKWAGSGSGSAGAKPAALPSGRAAGPAPGGAMFGRRSGLSSAGSHSLMASPATDPSEGGRAGSSWTSARGRAGARRGRR